MHNKDKKGQVRNCSRKVRKLDLNFRFEINTSVIWMCMKVDWKVGVCLCQNPVLFQIFSLVMTPLLQWFLGGSRRSHFSVPSIWKLHGNHASREWWENEMMRLIWNKMLYDWILLPAWWWIEFEWYYVIGKVSLIHYWVLVCDATHN